MSLEVPYGPSKLEVEEKLEHQVVEEKVENPVSGEKVEAVVEDLPEECSSLEGKEEEYYSADEMPPLNDDIDVPREGDKSKKEEKEEEKKKEPDVSQVRVTSVFVLWTDISREIPVHIIRKEWVYKCIFLLCKCSCIIYVHCTSM